MKAQMCNVFWRLRLRALLAGIAGHRAGGREERLASGLRWWSKVFWIRFLWPYLGSRKPKRI